MKQLLIGCGARREHLTGAVWSELTTLDINPDHKPDVEWDLTRLPLPFEDNSFDEIHAYEVLEHTGQQGDYRFFFAQFSDFWRILKPDGMIIGTAPAVGSRWLWGDPSHSRAFTSENLVFLDQATYTAQIGRTMMSDFRYLYRADFMPVKVVNTPEAFVFMIRAVKPSRIAWQKS